MAEYACTAVRKGDHALLPPLADMKPHPLPPSSTPDTATTDSSGKYVVGRCPTCKQRTVWKAVHA